MNPQLPVIRIAALEDARSIALLSNQLGYIADKEKIKKRLQSILTHKENCVFVAILQQNVVGWIHGFYTMRVESEEFVEIAGLVVHEDFRKRNIGKALVDEVIEWAGNFPCRKIRVRCNTIRTESHKFYERIGFELVKEQKIFNLEITN